MPKHVLLILALCVIGTVAAIAYWFHTMNGPVNSSGGQPPTSCSVQTAQYDCGKLRCISHVWYCDNHGAPICSEGRCVCFYGCL